MVDQALLRINEERLVKPPAGSGGILTLKKGNGGRGCEHASRFRAVLEPCPERCGRNSRPRAASGGLLQN